MKMLVYLFIFTLFLCAIVYGADQPVPLPADTRTDPISTPYGGDDNKLTISDRFDGECTLMRYDCLPSYYWTVPGLADYCFMRFSVENSDTSLSTLYISLYEPQKVDTPSVDIIVCADDGSGLPDINTIYYQTTIAYGDIVWHPNFLTVDVTAENLVFHDDYHVGFTTNRTHAPQGTLAVTTDNGTCGTERSTIFRVISWFHLRDVAAADYNFLIRTTMCNYDYDGDAIVNDSDNCPNHANPLQENGDGDEIGDACDNCPDTANANQFDADNDTFGDVCDNCPDTANADQFNSDTDSLGDACDNCPQIDNEDQANDDSDGFGNLCDICPNDEFNDADDDSLCADVDNCPNIYNPLQEDADGDLIGDACDECTDLDDDGYGHPDYPANTCAVDNCPGLSNPDQEDWDGDGIGDSCDTCFDSDNDGYGNPEFIENLCDADNCPDTANADQLNSDTDSYGDPCDNCPLVDNEDQADDDSDGIGNLCDICPNDEFNDADDDSLCADVDNCPTIYNPLQEDADGDLIGDVCDDCTDIDDDGFGDPDYPANTCVEDNCPGVANADQTDLDEDGIGDSCDTCTDSDNDGFGNPGYAANECDEDNCPDISNPDQIDTDNDQIGDSCDVCPLDDENDIDGDGYCANEDNCHKTYNTDQVDTDGDGIGDACEVRDSVYIDIAKVGETASADTLFSGFEYQIRIWIKNEVLLGAVSLGFRFDWDSTVAMTWLPRENGYGPGGQGTGLSCVTVVPDSRMYPPDNVWDLGGFIVNEVDMNTTSPDSILLGGASFNGRFYEGELEHMLSFHFKPEVFDNEMHTLCVDSCNIPPTSDFFFVDFDGEIMDVELNRDLCWLITKLCGDANGDGLVNIGDAVFLITFVFGGGDPPVPYLSGDENGDGHVNIGDAVYLINHIFNSGPKPICP